MSNIKRDVLTVANAVSIVGLILTIAGAFNIEHIAGAILIAIGRLLDVLDGKIARATHSSRFGAGIDATCDKLGLAFILPALWIAQMAPKWILIYIIVQNIINIILSLVALYRKITMHSSKQGKQAMFLQNLCLAGFIFGGVLNLHIISILASIVGIISLYWSVQASYSYFKFVFKN